MSAHREKRFTYCTFLTIVIVLQVGILEWVPNTVPLKDVISKEMGKDPTILQLNPQVLQ